MPEVPTNNPFAHLQGLFFTARTDPQIRNTPGGPMSYVWAGIHSDFENAGQPVPPGAFQAVNQMWRWSSEVIQADQALSRSLSAQEESSTPITIGGQHVAQSLDSRPLGDRPLGDQFSVVYRTVYSFQGETFTDTFQHDFGYNLPATIPALQAEIDAAAALQVSDYGYDWEGVAVPISIRAY